MRRTLFSLVVLCYLGALAYFAFRPFEPIPGLRFDSAPFDLVDGAVHIRTGAALEDRRNVAKMSKALVKSGRMTLEVVLKTDSLDQSGAARIISYSCDPHYRNFTLAQQGNGLEFRLRTTETDPNGVQSSLVVPEVFDAGKMQHLVVVYDGSEIRLYVDGKPRQQVSELHGDFTNWGKNHALVIGDEPAGCRPWFGWIRRYSVYDRALSSSEVARLHNGEAVPDSVATHNFEATQEQGGDTLDGLVRLQYRNLFITTDPTAYQLTDCVLNVAAFAPLGFFAYMLLPAHIERRKILAVILLPVLIGLFTSGLVEGTQRYIHGRIPCLPDLVYNVTGTLLGSLFAWLAFSTYEQKTMKWRAS